MISFIKRVWSAKICHWFWALADQGVVSLGTFLTNIVLARALFPAEYGIFALLCGIFYFLNSLHSALVIIPLTTRGAGTETPEMQRLATGSMALTGILILPQAAIVGLATYAVGRADLCPWAIMALTLWQFQESIRRTFMARLRHLEAALGDAISYLGQAAIVWACAGHWRLSVKGALIIMAVTSVAAGLVQIIQHGLKWVGSVEIRRLAVLHWELGRWILLTNLAGGFLTQIYAWALAFFHGIATSAKYQAVLNVLGISHPIIIGISSLIYPAVAKVRGERGEREAIKAGFSHGLLGSLLLLPFYSILTIWPRWVLQLFYGADSPYLDLTESLRLFPVCYMIHYFAILTVAILNSLERTRAGFFSQIASVTVATFIGLPLTAWGGMMGAIAASCLSSLTLLMTSSFHLKQTREKAKNVITALSH